MLFEAVLGQAKLVPITILWTDETGVPTDPTGNSTVTIYAPAVGGLTVVAGPTNLVKQDGKTGFFGTMLDISDTTVFGSEVYVCLFQGTIAGIATATEDFFRIRDEYTEEAA